jgi:Protein of unknown function (DUF664)
VDPAAEHAGELLVRKGERVPEAAEHVGTCRVDEALGHHREAELVPDVGERLNVRIEHRSARPYGSADRGFRAVGAILSRHDIVLSPHRGTSVATHALHHLTPSMPRQWCWAATFRTLTVRNAVYGGDMTNSDYPWEPPMAGTEAEHLTGALDRLRTTFRFKADDLDAAGLQVRIGASSLTIGGLLKHLAVCEDYMFTVKLSGAPIGAPWEGADWDGDNDWEFTSAADDTPERLYELWDGAVERSRARLNAALANGGLDQSVHFADPDGRHANLRRLVCDLIEEYGRHTGHADLLREAVDGRVGEDPPAGWRPKSGNFSVTG